MKHTVAVSCSWKFPDGAPSGTVIRPPGPRRSLVVPECAQGGSHDSRLSISVQSATAGDAVAVWLYGEHLTIAFADEALAQYGVTYQRDHQHLATVIEEHRFETPYQSPQRELWEPQPDEWLTVLRVAPYAPRRPRPTSESHQLRLSSDEMDALATG